MLVLAASCMAVAVAIQRGGDAGGEAVRTGPIDLAGPTVLREGPSPPALLAVAGLDAVRREPVAEAPRKCPVSVQVLLARDLRPVPEAAVSALVRGVGEHLARTIHATTDATGQTVFLITPGSTLQQLRVRAGPDTTGVTSWVHRTVSPDRRERVVLEVSRGAEVRGRVVDLQGRGLAGAELRAWCASVRDVDAEALPRPDRTTVTADDGSFVLEHVGNEFVLEAELPPRVCWKRVAGRAEPGTAVTGLEIVLGGSRDIVGTVLDEEGRPLPGVTVRTARVADIDPLQHAESERAWSASPAARGVVTDARGAFRFEALPDREHHLLIDHRGFMPARIRVPSGKKAVDIALARGSSVWGTVLGTDGNPAEDAVVTVRSERAILAGKSTIRATTDSRGEFLLSGFEPDEEAALLVEADGHEIYVQHPFVIGGDSHRPAVIRLRLESVLSGHVRGADHEPLAGALVRIAGSRVLQGPFSPRPTTWEAACGQDEVWTDGEGAFRFTNLYPGRFQIEVTHPEIPLAVLRSTVLAPADKVDLRLTANADSPAILDRLHGRVSDATTGRAVREFEVTVFERLPGDGARGTTITWENDTGDFQLPYRRSLTSRVSIEAEGYAPFEYRDFPAEGGPVSVSAALLPARSLHLEVVKREGEPLRHGVVRFLTEQGRVLPVRGGPDSMTVELGLDEHGRAHAHLLPATRILVRVSAADEPWLAEFSEDLSSEREATRRYVTDEPDRRPTRFLIRSVAGGHTPAREGLLRPERIAIAELDREQADLARQTDTFSMSVTCAGRVTRVTGTREGDGTWRIEASGATIRGTRTVDGCAVVAIPLPPGDARVEVSAPGHLPAIWLLPSERLDGAGRGDDSLWGLPLVRGS